MDTRDLPQTLRNMHAYKARYIDLFSPYMAMTSTVGNLPVEGLSLHYGQASIMTPSDFPFARDGIAAEGTPNIKQIVIADVNTAVLQEARINGSVIPLDYKRRDVYARQVDRFTFDETVRN